MILVVDIGNTRIKWACVSGRTLVDPGEAVHERIPATALESLAEAAPGRPDRVVAVNVAGESFVAAFTDMVKRRWDLSPSSPRRNMEGHGVRCAYADPSRMGSDRWVALIAGFKFAAGAACVIDAGTAVTLDAVDSRGRHLGGLILAGSRVIATALDRQTSGIGETLGRSRPGRGAAYWGPVRTRRWPRGRCWVLPGLWTGRYRPSPANWPNSPPSTSPAVTPQGSPHGWRHPVSTALTWCSRGSAPSRERWTLARTAAEGFRVGW